MRGMYIYGLPLGMRAMVPTCMHAHPTIRVRIRVPPQRPPMHVRTQVPRAVLLRNARTVPELPAPTPEKVALAGQAGLENRRSRPTKRIGRGSAMPHPANPPLRASTLTPPTCSVSWPSACPLPSCLCLSSFASSSSLLLLLLRLLPLLLLLLLLLLLPVSSTPELAAGPFHRAIHGHGAFVPPGLCRGTV